MNLFTSELAKELTDFQQEIQKESSVKVIVFRSTNPDFFIAHYNVERIRYSADKYPAPEYINRPNAFQRLMEAYRTLPQVTIAEVAGACRGGGMEFVLNMDMRFAVQDKAKFCQPEVALGLMAAGSGCSHLARTIGLARAMEITLGCDDFDAELAERYGIVNRVLEAEQCPDFVDNLARRIASYNQFALQCSKEFFQNIGNQQESLIEENKRLIALIKTEETRKVLKDFMSAGGQTSTGEKEFQTILARINQDK